MLWLALVGRDSATRCSQLIGIRAETAALALDMACSIRLLQFENEREVNRNRTFENSIKRAVGELFGGISQEEMIDSMPELSENDFL